MTSTVATHSGVIALLQEKPTVTSFSAALVLFTGDRVEVSSYSASVAIFNTAIVPGGGTRRRIVNIQGG